MLLVVDNGSIYTKQLTDFLTQKKFSFEKYTPNTLELNSLKKYESIILSGRRKNDKKINEINSKVIKYSIDNNKKFPKNAFMTPLGYDFKKSLEKRIDKIKNET